MSGRVESLQIRKYAAEERDVCISSQLVFVESVKIDFFNFVISFLVFVELLRTLLLIHRPLMKIQIRKYTYEVESI